MAVVYFHYKKDSNELFYVGVGLKKERAYSKRSRNPLWHNIVKKHGYDIKIYREGISYNKSKEIEIELISKFGRLDLGTGILCNMTNGGDGHNGMSDDCRKKISKSLEGRKVNKKSLEKRRKTQKALWNSDEYSNMRNQAKARAKKYHKLGVISRKGCVSPMKGVAMPGRTKEKLRNSLKEYYKNNEPANKKHCKVVQMSKEGVIIKIWESHHEACNYFGNKNVKNLIKVCRGIGKSYMGFKWRYYDQLQDIKERN